MPLSGVHILLTYACNFECDHCFLFCGPRARGTFTIAQIRQLLEQARDLGTVSSIYIEGGEPFLYYPVMVESLRLAGEMGFRTGVISNCYWATSKEDATLWLEPVTAAGINDLSLSDDMFHHGSGEENPAARASSAAIELGLASTSICIENPQDQSPQDDKGKPVVGAGAMLRGRAAEKLAEGVSTRAVDTFRTCPYEDLVSPGRVHIDAFGNVHACQGVSIGNIWRKPLKTLMSEYDAEAHPICGPLVRGGPRALALEHGIELQGEFVDECHYCYSVRRAMLDRFPEALTPLQVYGLEDDLPPDAQ
ncbi:MAG: hypothetical protein GY854_27105 [Deltaproteobacteria bacterium]|nr:hypothetical protein [Deltaproteobacteria bacterium]